MESAAQLAAVEIAQITHRRGLGFQPVGHDSSRFLMVLERLFQEPQRFGFVQFFRDIAFQNFTFVIDSTLQIVTFAATSDERLVKAPMPLAIGLELSNSALADLVCKHRPETVPPKPYSLGH